MVAVDPVEDVECAIGTQSEQVVAGDRLCLPSLRDHEQLGKDGDGLEVDGKSPQDFHRGELVVEDHGQDCYGSEEELHPEGVVVAVISCAEFDVHQVHRGCCRCNEEHLYGTRSVYSVYKQYATGNLEYLHDCIVDTDKVGDEVEVSGDKDHKEENLRFPRDSRTAPCFPYLLIRA